MKGIDLALTKEEIPIMGNTFFQVPIHHKLLDSRLNIDRTIAKKVFSNVAEGWYNDLKKYTSQKKLSKEDNEWINRVFLKEKPIIQEEYGRQVIKTLNWEDTAIVGDNGFVTSFCIDRNYGGSLYFLKERGCEAPISLENPDSSYIKFSPDKAKEFGCRTLGEEGEKFVMVYVYGQHNVDHYPGALFLRNWAISYMNEALKFVKS